MKDENARCITICLLSIGIACIVFGMIDLMQSDAEFEALRTAGAIPESVSMHIRGLCYLSTSLAAFIFGVIINNHQLRKDAEGKENERTERD